MKCSDFKKANDIFVEFTPQFLNIIRNYFQTEDQEKVVYFSYHYINLIKVLCSSNNRFSNQRAPAPSNISQITDFLKDLM